MRSNRESNWWSREHRVIAAVKDMITVSQRFAGAGNEFDINRNDRELLDELRRGRGLMWLSLHQDIYKGLFSNGEKALPILAIEARYCVRVDDQSAESPFVLLIRCAENCDERTEQIEADDKR